MPTNPLLAISAKELKRALEMREEIDRLRKEFDRILGIESFAKTGPIPKRPKRRRKMSAAARAKISAAARARWKKVKARGRKSL